MDVIGGLLVLLGVAAVVTLLALTAMVVHGARRPPRHTAAYAVARSLPCDPGELGWTFDDWVLERPGGTRLPVWEIPVRQPLAAPAPRTAILVHGWGQSRIDMLARARPWVQLFERVVMYDLRGHGDSSGAVTRLGDEECEDLLALLAGLEPSVTVLVGYSMGGWIALEAAARCPDKVSGVVTHGCYHDLHTSLAGRLRLLRLPTRPITDLALAWLWLLGVRPRSLLPAARRLRCPVLLVHGRDDRVAPPEHAEMLAAAAPQATLFWVDDATHLDMPSGEEPAYRAAVAAFVSELA